ncbi:hypothetical protein ABEB36_012827 [Hypothenemus hampei]|uniref:Uncharacterized protein n=1 Tax=Hypothenemus hampei TaxID=57062 RepID=A0ABD1E5X7_HYPHA
MSYRGPFSTQISNSDSDSDSDSGLARPYNRSRSRSPIRSTSKINPIENNNNSNFTPIINTMALPQLKQEYLNMIPDFFGEPNLLPRFIEISENLVKKFYNRQDVTDFQNEYLMSSILAKIKGDAAINISSCKSKVGTI